MTAQHHDARLVYAVWQRAIADEAIADAVIDDRLDELTDRFDPDELAVLRDFGAHPGFRWAVENLRYRATTMIVRNLSKRMPRTARLITGGNPDWLRDLAGEYLVRHHWRDLGHRYNAECLRFAGFITRHVARRRLLGDACAAALAYETGILTVLVRAAEQTDWPAGVRAGASAGDADPRWQPRRNPCAVIAQLPVDLVAWLQAGEGPPIPTRQAPVALVMYMPTSDASVHIERLTDIDTTILHAVRGGSPVTELARAIHETEGIDLADVEHALRRWRRSRVLM